jgi:hypothetical protein
MMAQPARQCRGDGRSAPDPVAFTALWMPEGLKITPDLTVAAGASRQKRQEFFGASAPTTLQSFKADDRRAGMTTPLRRRKSARAITPRSNVGQCSFEQTATATLSGHPKARVARAALTANACAEP